YTQGEDNQPWSPMSERAMVPTLGGLVIVFLIYMFMKQQEISRLRVEALKGQIDMSALEGSMQRLLGLFETSVELASAEPRRAEALAARQARHAFNGTAAAFYHVDNAGSPTLIACDPGDDHLPHGIELDVHVKRMFDPAAAALTARP